MTRKRVTYVNHVITFEMSVDEDGNEEFDLLDEDELVGQEEYLTYEDARHGALPFTNMSDGLTETLKSLDDGTDKTRAKLFDQLLEYFVESEHQGYDGWEGNEVTTIRKLRADIVLFLRNYG